MKLKSFNRIGRLVGKSPDIFSSLFFFVKELVKLFQKRFLLCTLGLNNNKVICPRRQKISYETLKLSHCTPFISRS